MENHLPLTLAQEQALFSAADLEDQAALEAVASAYASNGYRQEANWYLLRDAERILRDEA